MLAELLEEKGHKDRLRYASGGNETCKFAVAQCTGGELRGTVVGQLPREDLKGGEASHSCFARPLGGLNCTM